MRYAKLNRLAFALAFSIFWGSSVFIFTIWALFIDKPHLLSIFEYYPGYSPNMVGAFVGLLWGLVDGFFAGFIFAALYNFILWLLTTRKKDRDFVNSLDNGEED